MNMNIKKALRLLDKEFLCDECAFYEDETECNTNCLYVWLKGRLEEIIVLETYIKTNINPSDDD